MLGGTGAISGPVTVNSGASLLGGNGATASGALSVANNLTLNSGANILLVLGANGAHSSLVRTGGTWTFASNQRFSFINGGAQPGFYDNIITGLAGDPGTEASWTINTFGFVGTFSYDGAGNIDLNLTAAPAPPPPPPNCTWTNAAVYPIPVVDNGAATVGATLYSFGGVSNGALVANAYKFDGTTWTPIAPLPQALSKPAVVSDGTSAYIINWSQRFGQFSQHSLPL